MSGKPKTRWCVKVQKKADGEAMDTFAILAHKRTWAERLGVILSADQWGLNTSALEAKAEPWDSKTHGAVTPDSHEYLAAAAYAED